jgi:Ca2+-binding RTX toxin-like protein
LPFENLTLGGTMTTGIGTTSNNVITGNDNGDTLDGGTGVDTLIGGLGNDIYLVRSAADLVTNAGGTDTVDAFCSYDMSLHATNVANLTLLTGGVIGIGNNLDNIITGNASANTLSGGGAGNDTLIGGLGNDVYIVDHAGVTIIESVGGGSDTVKSSLPIVDLTQLAYANVENLVLTAPGHLGIGTAGVNSLVGSSGTDTLDGGGGADKMAGGLGDDTYFVDNSADSVTESTGGGTDTVISTALSYTMANNVEILTLQGGAVKGIGNTGSNFITGDALANSLSGGNGNDTLEGGMGADTLTGGGGTDTFLFKAASMDGTIDAITDFSKALGGDVIDIHDLLTGYTPGVSVISNFVEITTVGTHSALFVDGAGTGTFTTQIATINGTGLTDVNALVATGHLFLG